MNSFRVVDELNNTALPNGREVRELEITEGLSGIASLPHGITFQEII